jgi:hypothetical protein
MPRRDAFSMLRGASSPSPVNEKPPSKTAVRPLETQTIQPLDFIPNAEPRKKRERQWEKAHRGQVATYRGVPPEMHQTMLRLAENLEVPVDEVARAFLEFSLIRHKSGDLPICPHPKAQRMTLYPDGLAVSDRKSEGWRKEAFSSARPGKKSKKGDQPKRWETRVSYRLPVALKQEVKELADAQTVGVGELVFFLFQHALADYESGALRLEAQPKVSGNTLFS